MVSTGWLISAPTTGFACPALSSTFCWAQKNVSYGHRAWGGYWANFAAGLMYEILFNRAKI
jgi:hypothetical protein